MKVSVIVFFAVVFGILIYVWVQPVEKIKNKHIQQLKNINIQTIESVRMFYERKKYEDMEDPPIKALSRSEIEELLKIFSSAIKSNKSHPHFIRGWDVEIYFTDHSKKELKVFLERDDSRYMYFWSRGDKLFEGTGELKSVELRNWMKKIDLL